MASETRRSASITETVTRPLTTVHLPPERAVITTPAMVGLMERCIARVEDEARWQSRSVEVRHRSGLKTGEQIRITAQVGESADGRVSWSVRAEADDGRLIGDGTIIRERIG